MLEHTNRHTEDFTRKRDKLEAFEGDLTLTVQIFDDDQVVRGCLYALANIKRLTLKQLEKYSKKGGKAGGSDAQSGNKGGQARTGADHSENSGSNKKTSEDDSSDSHERHSGGPGPQHGQGGGPKGKHGPGKGPKGK